MVLGACAQGMSEDPDAGTSSTRDTGVTPTPDGGNVGIDRFVPSSCGDGVRNGTDECEGDDLADATCESLGYAGGTLACSVECTFDKSACVESMCGNARRDDGEDCDASDLGGASCTDVGFLGGTLACDGRCGFDTSGCTRCGDGMLQEGEECDGSNLGGQACTDRGFTGGALGCTAACAFDESACENADCPDGTRNGDEDCDGADLGGRVCANLGFYAGDLSCDDSCRFDTSSCTNCGNGRIDGVEQCDGANLNGGTCETAGEFTMGTLRCGADCTFDTSGCSAAMCGNGVLDPGEGCDDRNVRNGDGCDDACAVESGYRCTGAPSTCETVCGDGMIVGGEVCDGSNLAGETCRTQGFDSGTLRCDACALDTSSCTSISCGNGTVETGEECDDGNTTGFDGCNSSCQVEDTFYLPVRLAGGGGNTGRVEVEYGGAWRDVCDDIYTTEFREGFADVVCRQLGFTGTGHTTTLRQTGSGNPIMDDLECTGSETSLAQCPFAGWGIENCGTTEAIHVTCAPGEGDIRLVDGPSSMDGRLQVYHSGAWGEVCDDLIQPEYGAGGLLTVATICQELGYKDGVFVSTYDSPTADFLLDNVQCVGSEFRMVDCAHTDWGSDNCGTTEGAGIRCETYADGDARLVGGTTRNHGRVEVLHQGVWGSVCDDYIQFSGTRQDQAMSVICNEQGYTGGGTFVSTPRIPGVDPTWMDDIDCAGTESRISECPFRGWGSENCSHNEDTVVTCMPGT